MLDNVLILLALSVFSVALFRRVNIPAVLGYLLVGLLAGDHAFGLLHDSHALEQIAEIGVVFLLFTIGLEVSIPRLIAMRRIVFGIGTVQVVVSTLSTIAVCLYFGLTWQAAFAVGGAMAMSSTAIVTKLLTQQYELHLPHGNISLGVLLLQDLAVVPFLVLIPIFAAPAGGPLLLPVILALTKGTVAFAVIYFAGQYLIRPAVRIVVSAKSKELFTLFVLLVALLAAWLTAKLGLSLAMGAFLAGMMLAETEFEHHIEREIRPFRDVLLGLFFIIVGTEFDWHIFLTEAFEVTVMTIGLIAGKGIAVVLISIWAGYARGIAMRAGILLGQGSEFGFALLAVAITTGLISLELSQPIIAAIILSMLISPLLIRHNEAIARRFAPEYAVSLDRYDMSIGEACKDLSGHVVLCGFGRTGQTLAHFLKRVNIPFVAIETSSEIVNEAREAGEPVYLADAAKADTLPLLGITNALALVVTFAETKAAQKIAGLASEISPNVPTIIRTRDDLLLEQLLESGADEVIPDTVESSMMLARHTLTAVGESRETIFDMLEEARQENYATIRAYFHKSASEDPKLDSKHHLRSIEVLQDYYANENSIDSLRQLQKVRVVGLRRDEAITENPAAETKLRAGDVLIVEGHPEDIQAAEIEIMSGR
ncbi:MAG: cation:proton antiporter [Gammaproteobacteria bacterium]|nr:cation:proton antiporter [Gammaproteobacteria bacterium]